MREAVDLGLALEPLDLLEVLLEDLAAGAERPVEALHLGRGAFLAPGPAALGAAEPEAPHVVADAPPAQRIHEGGEARATPLESVTGLGRTPGRGLHAVRG